MTTYNRNKQLVYVLRLQMVKSVIKPYSPWVCLTPHTSEMFHFLYITVIWRYHQSRSFNYYTQRALVFHMYQTALHFSYNAHVIQCRSRSLSFNNQVALTWFGIIFEAVRRGHLTFCLLWVMFFLIVHPLKKS